jgi:transcriptional regulator with XRE-family HTH domain
MVASTLSDTFRRNLRTALDEIGLTQRDLAARSGVNHVHICRILAGKHVPSLTMCEALARGVRLPPEKLLSKTGQ